MSFFVTDVEYEKRKSICGNCPHHRKKLDQCGKCGCFLKAKAKLVKQSCPLKKW